MLGHILHQAGSTDSQSSVKDWRVTVMWFVTEISPSLPFPSLYLTLAFLIMLCILQCRQITPAALPEFLFCLSVLLVWK